MRNLVFPLAIMLATTTQAGEFDSMIFANQMGDVLASEATCELSYNPDAIAAFIEKKVPADDISFTSTLNLMTMGAKHQQSTMTPSSKIAHCTQIRRVAKSYGFIE